MSWQDGWWCRFWWCWIGPWYTINDPSFVQAPSFVHLEFFPQFTLNLYQTSYITYITLAYHSPGISFVKNATGNKEHNGSSVTLAGWCCVGPWHPSSWTSSRQTHATMLWCHHPTDSFGNIDQGNSADVTWCDWTNDGAWTKDGSMIVCGICNLVSDGSHIHSDLVLQRCQDNSTLVPQNEVRWL